MRIVFHTNQISERGTEIAIFDYPLGNKNILGGESFIAAPHNSYIDDSVLKRFVSIFNVILYRSIQELEFYINNNNIDLIYSIESGELNNLITTKIPTFIHCVFTTKYPHGKYYCPVSNFLNKYYFTKYPVLPHIVKPFPGSTSNLREYLNIPLNAFVFGSYGGRNQFDIDFVKKTIIEIAKNNIDIYFIFMNHEKFFDGLKNVIFLPKSTDINFKESFINTCNAMLHARSDGETFGLSIAEFSIKNKPILTWKPTIIYNPIFILKEKIRQICGRKHRYATAHIEILGKKGVYYHNSFTLKKVIINLTKNKIYLFNDYYNCYLNKFNEETVMKIFYNIINNKNQY